MHPFFCADLLRTINSTPRPAEEEEDDFEDAPEVAVSTSQARSNEHF
jgi:hypothetical protein